MESQQASAGTADLAGLAGLLADRTRASFCLALLDGTGRAVALTDAGRSALEQYLGGLPLDTER